ncbi:hypothetical protein AB0J38_13660 [Streptomyces sp. NPDC050095]|uniref:hypothetical protein n=1 Tax=unclassified Streptomyces TaxID=2593676 RepID=UPI003427B4A8
MPNSINLPCKTCVPHRSRPHNPLTGDQKDWLRRNKGVKYTGDWWKCAEVGCLTARPFASEANSVQFPPGIA